MNRRSQALALLLLAVSVGLLLWQQKPPPITDVFDEGLSQSDYDRLKSSVVTAERFRANLAILDPTNSLQPFVKQTPLGVSLLQAPEGPVLTEIEFGEPPNNPAPPRRGLEGLRILLDPGHYGGAWSTAEKRHIVVRDLAVREGSLNWATALVLEELLKKSGARVYLSRRPPPTTPFPEPPTSAFERDQELIDWLETRLAHRALPSFLRDHPIQLRLFRNDWNASVDDPETTFFDIFNRFDLYRRGAMAAEVAADLSLSLHYNVAKDPQTNRVVVFMPGAVMPDEMLSGPVRYYTFRRALTDDLEYLEPLALSISRGMQKALGLPASDNVGHPPSPKKHPINEEQGVFARNLAVLKRTRGLVLLLEGPCMNNPKEHRRLQDDSLELDGDRYPARASAYARGVFRGLERQSALLWRFKHSRTSP